MTCFPRSLTKLISAQPFFVLIVLLELGITGLTAPPTFACCYDPPEYADTSEEVQSPAAAADLFRNLTGDYSIEGIAKARADSFINPATGQLEAGGFGGSYNRLFTDQRSRAGTYDYKRRF